MSRSSWSLTIGRLEVHYGFRRRPWPYTKGWFRVIRSRSEYSTATWVSLFGKKFIYYGRDGYSDALFGGAPPREGTPNE